MSLMMMGVDRGRKRSRVLISTHCGNSRTRKAEIDAHELLLRKESMLGKSTADLIAKKICHPPEYSKAAQ
jgi:hypothetical protein